MWRRDTMDSRILEELVKNAEHYKAHVKKDKDGVTLITETLTQHTDLIVKYFERLWKSKGIVQMLAFFDRQGQDGREMSCEAKHFLEEMIFAIPVFHDLGKINPDFQQKLMDEKARTATPDFLGIGSKHSILSAVLYIDYFLGALRNAVRDKNEKKELRCYVLYHAYIISRHHSDLEEFEKFLKELEQGEGCELIKRFSEHHRDIYQKPFSLTPDKMKSLIKEIKEQRKAKKTKEEKIRVYIYIRMLYSLLVASDYYAAAEFFSGTEVSHMGKLDEISRWMDIYEETSIMKSIRRHQTEEYPMPSEQFMQEKDINKLRAELFLDAEGTLNCHREENLFFLEAPTGSGKSNTAVNLSFQMMKADERLGKIFYIYPFNTLVEQNKRSLYKIFEENADILNNIVVVNSLTPIKVSEEEENEKTMDAYQKALLDRQFLNYPMILSTHVSLFDIMFGCTKESAFGFHQLMNSIVVLDEIQSYKNRIWGEIIYFLKEFACILNIKVIIMSATLPDLNVLTAGGGLARRLIEDRNKYFGHERFKNRVTISYELLGMQETENVLTEYIKKFCREEKKVLVEFIKKKTAFRFYTKLLEEKIGCEIEYLSGDDSLAERERILNKVKTARKGIILIATQVVEAGVDIDMDVGFKNISKLDSEEQFLGRINRSCLRSGTVYFFKVDEPQEIYKEDIRIQKDFTLENETMRIFLKDKNFHDYYSQILSVLKTNINEAVSSEGLEEFFGEKVGKLNFPCIAERMKLISESQWSMSVYLARKLTDENGNEMDGRQIWQEYVELLQDFSMDYAQKKIRLSQVTSRMHHFIYQIKKNNHLTYNDHIGEIFYIEEGEKYFENGKINREKLQGEIGGFVDFI